MTTFKTAMLATVGSLVLALSLSACGSNQTAAEACDIVEKTIESSPVLEQDDVTTAEIAKMYEDAAKKVSNKEVRDTVNEAADILSKYADLFEKDQNDPESLDDADVEKLTKAEEELEKVGGKLDKLCKTSDSDDEE